MDELATKIEAIKDRCKEVSATGGTDGDSKIQLPASDMMRILEYVETYRKYKTVLEKIDMLAEAGLCQMSIGGKHEYLKDIRREVSNEGLNGGIVEFKKS